MDPLCRDRLTAIVAVVRFDITGASLRRDRPLRDDFVTPRWALGGGVDAGVRLARRRSWRVRLPWPARNVQLEWLMSSRGGRIATIGKTAERSCTPRRYLGARSFSRNASVCPAHVRTQRQRFSLPLYAECQSHSAVQAGARRLKSRTRRVPLIGVVKSPLDGIKLEAIHAPSRSPSAGNRFRP